MATQLHESGREWCSSVISQSFLCAVHGIRSVFLLYKVASFVFVIIIAVVIFSVLVTLRLLEVCLSTLRLLIQYLFFRNNDTSTQICQRWGTVLLKFSRNKKNLCNIVNNLSFLEKWRAKIEVEKMTIPLDNIHDILFLIVFTLKDMPVQHSCEHS
jgi:hypothetical protein